MKPGRIKEWKNSQRNREEEQCMNLAWAAHAHAKCTAMPKPILLCSCAKIKKFDMVYACYMA